MDYPAKVLENAKFMKPFDFVVVVAVVVIINIVVVDINVVAVALLVFTDHIILSYGQ